jgi:unsaturated chondroitin disaccharide hydrolase
MPLKIDNTLTPKKLLPAIARMWELSARKILAIEKTWKPADGTPVFTVKGKYTSRGWTEWTQGFQFGSAILQFDATGDERFLEIGRSKTIELMASHVSHTGVHDHGFNNISTYGNLLRLMREGRIPWNDREKDFYELALKVSGAVQAARWTKLADGTGFIHSFNGPHSLFVDTIRSCRSLAVAHRLGHCLMGEQDEKVSLLRRLVEHIRNTSYYNLYDGTGHDAYDASGRTAHEAIFNTANGAFRCLNSQQGYSPFSTWTRGLAWAVLGLAEELEFIEALESFEFDQAAAPPFLAKFLADARKDSNRERRIAANLREDIVEAGQNARKLMTKYALITADYFIEQSCRDGIPMWDTGAPNLHRLPPNYLSNPSDPYNAWEPVDSSAAAIAAQGLIRLGNYLANDKARNPKLQTRNQKLASHYKQAGLTIARTLFSEPYLSLNPKHQGLILHSVYHRPNGWDYVAPGQKVPNGESSMWGDYHARELALLIQREAQGEPYLTFFGCVG